MIRHHEVQDSLSAEAASVYLGSSATTMPHAAQHPGAVAIRYSGHSASGVTPGHPFAFYAAPLSSVVLMVAVAVALGEFVKVVAPRLKWVAATKGFRRFHVIKSASHGYRISRR